MFPIPRGYYCGGKEYTEYLKAVENKKNQNDVPKPVPGIINQSIKKKEQPLEQAQKADRISPPQPQDKSEPITKGIFYKSLAPGQELSEDDKKQAKETLILSKVGEQLKLHLCYEEVWEEIVLLKDSEWLGKARKIIIGSNSLEFEPQLKITTKFDADLVQQLKLKAHEHLAGRKAQNRLNAREQEPELWKLRNFLIHEFYIDCPWREVPEKEKFLLALAATLSTGGRPSSQIPDTCCSVSTSPNLLLERMNTELEALKSAFKSFATGGGLAQAFFSYYPERLGSCYASLIIIVECNVLHVL